jgi:hypothetical protein
VPQGAPSGGVNANAHKRKDINDLGQLEKFLAERGLEHAFKFMFRGCV